MQTAPKSLRLHIGLFGRMNVGKSSFLNMIAGQDVAITSPVAGTTTDVVEKTMELLPLGPVVFLDTAGLDDASALGEQRIERTMRALDRSDAAFLLVEADIWGEAETDIVRVFKEKKKPFALVVNKADALPPSEGFLSRLRGEADRVLVVSSSPKIFADASARSAQVNVLKEALVHLCPEDRLSSRRLIGDLLQPGSLVVMVVPIDLQAPKGRLILPQVQAIRDTLDNDAAVLVVKEREYAAYLRQLKQPPALVVCDSQAILKTSADTPPGVRLTTFSILFARFKGDLDELARGAARIDGLKSGSRVLIAESCSHHTAQDDIGRVKIPRWLRQYTGFDLAVDHFSGRDFPTDLEKYDLIIHCGSCMLTRGEMLLRIHLAKERGVAITNYGAAISLVQGVLKRVLAPFPTALRAFEEEEVMLQIESGSVSWADRRIVSEQVMKYMDHGRNFIDDALIHSQLAAAPEEPDIRRVRDILARSLAVKDLTPEEVAVLINVNDPAALEEMRAAALAVKLKVYDNRIVTFAPLYLGNYCVNRCAYCGFNNDNCDAQRKVLSVDEIKKEVEVLAGVIGHKRLIVVYGEHPKNDVDYIVESLKAIYSVKVKTRHGHGSIRRVNVNAPAFSIEDLKRINDAGIGTYQVFQETYHKPTYARMHPSDTIKGDYDWRLYCMHRAMDAGIDDVGIGVLFGLYDWRFELMSLIYHTQELERRQGVGAHTISFPRLVPALNSMIGPDWKYLVNDEDFKKIMLIIRLAVPYTGMIITAREKASIRDEALQLGVTQMDASSRISIGGYSDAVTAQDKVKQQFILGDTRSLDELIRDLAAQGFITSFCTAGYRCGRTGKCIMDLLRSGTEGKFCKLNAILTFQEWLDDFGSDEARAAGLPLIEKEVEQAKAKNPKALEIFTDYHVRIKGGERDLYL